ncbi:hypothetical protein ABEB36_014108 [Hypothenemus hampei]|uniref:DUF4485 domain-containing protein n=1 Tax=Hypothenemus hampei TaxID=57062 RepID=A0ABD1E3M6_HYPHA
MAQDNLDIEFKQLLCIIRQHIPFINSNHYLGQCRIWLEKLSTMDVNKITRNSYLAELCKQIQTNILNVPFTEQPPEGDPAEQELCVVKQQDLVAINIEDNSCSWSDLTDSDSESKLDNLSPDALQITDKLQKKRKVKVDRSNSHNNGNSENLKEWDMKFVTDTNYICQDWKTTIGALQMRLSEMIQQNKDLNSVIQKLKLQLEDDNIKNQAQNQYNLTITETFHAQEIVKLKEKQSKDIFLLNKTLTEDFEKNLQKVSEDFKIQIEELKQRHEETLSKKDQEIYRLSQIIQKQCLRIMNDVSSLKNEVLSCSDTKNIHILKKCISKMEKAFQKSEREYLKEIERLKQELELKESSLQVQLKMQKAELLTQARTHQKEEFEETLNNLEVKYIQMLEAHEKQIMKIKKFDDAQILYLMELLEMNGINYEHLERGDQ